MHHVGFVKPATQTAMTPEILKLICNFQKLHKTLHVGYLFSSHRRFCNLLIDSSVFFLLAVSYNSIKEA